MCDKAFYSNPRGIDGSGLSPAVLRIVLDLCTRLPYREAHASLLLQRLPVSVSSCERLHQSYATLTRLGGVEGFSPLVHGLQRQLGVRQKDSLIGVADGALWIDELFDELGVRVRILDVYHATLYLERVMCAMGWPQVRRKAGRASWQRGDINARIWLKHYLPDPEQWLAWNEEDQAALRYLESRLAQMDYFDFKEQGYPIGSGVIEGANKSIIGARMKRGGMRWSHEGINRMATMRCEQASAQPLINFDLTRLIAFP